MKNLYLLPTDQPSRLAYVINTEKSTLTLFEDEMEKGKRFFPQNIYITSDEEIKKGDWVLFSDRNLLYKVEYTSQCFDYNNDEDCKKIILTTDQSLDGVQAIDDDFLELFVENPTCDRVELTTTNEI